jgi:hypothetical protein
MRSTFSPSRSSSSISVTVADRGRMMTLCRSRSASWRIGPIVRCSFSRLRFGLYLLDRFVGTRRGRKANAEVQNVRFLRRLNEHPNEARVQRVGKVIEFLQEADGLERALRPAYAEEKYPHDYSLDDKAASGWRFTAAETQKINDRYTRTLNKANRLLERYWWQPMVRSGSTFTGLQADPWPGARGRALPWENRAVYFVLELVSLGLLQRIRRCRECKAWFCAVTNHQVSCGDNCRKRFSSTSPEFKEKRRLYMRKYRERGKELDKHAKQHARKKGR